MRVVAVIPARHGSTRFPGKPLANILGKPMIQHVYERAKLAKQIDNVVVATDHHEIYDVVESFGGKAIITRTDHESGSDRIAEVAEKVEGDIYLNIQGDEPLIRFELINEIVALAKENQDCVITAKTKILDINDVMNPNVVKVVSGRDNNALYFSRSSIPYNRSNVNITYYKHLGIYCYPKKILMEYVNLPKSKLEEVEMLEQLRLLENGYSIKVIETSYDALGVDTPEDIQKVEKILEVQYA
ncbi:3-deoxy-manno-octulosonate cytidylyltransferase [Metabacillus halosaccharovorans]|uniref:3-deoxy-manno-octulosonate cytidylyltransferase n=1 Tax=Metabacillus halosaccharovorans TaxID=930124 RepID=A0ABT3DBQ3_9BACI|nr:3-deoxy-manno-octulosonate cytidylyltransferase [Metabacillus halosaccharovorans]MCV9884488.1 3-deoxy-manno-octulosonate cytidylyltransferase [Metabacillus halosaccharovorans]